MKKKIGVIGSNGFVGHHLVDEILTHYPEYELVAFVHDLQKHKIRFMNKVKDIRQIDILDTASLNEGLEDIDILVFSVMGSLEAIVQGFENTLRVAEDFGIEKIIYLSTIVVFGENPKEGTHDESPLLLKQESEYNRAKVQAESIVEFFRQRNILNIINIRPGYIYGEQGSYFTTDFLKKMRDDSDNFFLLGEGKGIFNGIYVKNLTRLIMLAIKSQIRNENFNAVDGYLLTWHDLFSSYAKILGKDIRNFRSLSREDILITKNNLISKIKARILKRIFFPKKQIVSNWRHNLYLCQHQYKMKKAKSLLNYAPFYSFREAMENIEDWVHKNLDLIFEDNSK